MIKACLPLNQLQVNERRKRKYHSRKSNSKCRGKWSDQENVVYFKFLLEHRREFQRPGQRKKNQVFLRMSRLLGTRTPDQCRSHHQKVENYAETKQVSDKLTYCPMYKELRGMFQQELSHLVETPGMQEIQRVQEDNYTIFGNDRGCFNMVIDIQAMGSW